MSNYIKYENYIIPFSSIIFLDKSEYKKRNPDYTETVVFKLNLKDGNSVDIPRDLKLIEEIQNNYITWLESQSNQQPKF